MTGRTIWLHRADGRVAAASADDVVLLLEFLEEPAALRAAGDFVAMAKPRASEVCLRRPTGLHLVLPGMLAGWIADVSQRPEIEIHRLCDGLQKWLAGDLQTDCRATPTVGVTGD